MTDQDGASYYRVFLLTVWQEPSQDADALSAVRFRLEDPRTGKRQGFATAEALMSALEKEVRVGRE